ncbi:hypothetical protein [uncultured Tateyamaria sp.]|uniref:hypothetical protein n=1 Tax=uncultured Tateyamaria sp. TaxID=455651 RepID=UPI002635FBC1|nr:hypothetical protein [uncultured Tateyamaria sp.]
MTDEQDLPVRRASFTANPETLDEAMRASCAAPGDELREVSGSVIQCRILPPPDFAAFLVLRYDGALEAPALVLQKETDQKDETYTVGLSFFAEVTQKSGNPRRIYFKLLGLDKMMDRLLISTGGMPEDF